jgi:hypothetical protein
VPSPGFADDGFVILPKIVDAVRKRMLSLHFPCVCPEPVLVKQRLPHGSAYKTATAAVFAGARETAQRKAGAVRKTALFVHVLYKNDHFTKTGSGQIGKALKKVPFCAGCCAASSIPAVHRTSAQSSIPRRV